VAKRRRGERRRTSQATADTKGVVGIAILHAECPAAAEGNRRGCFRLFIKVRANCRFRSCPIWTIEPEPSPRAQIPHKKQRPPGRIKPLQEGIDRSGDGYAARNAFAWCRAPLRRCKGEHYDRHSTSGRRALAQFGPAPGRDDQQGLVRRWR
jgi:hypothetical protein